MILCCGEALIDMLPRQSTLGEDSFAPVPGGATVNTATALGRLGVDVGLFSGISTDLFGGRLVEALEASNVTVLAHRSDRPTTLAFVTLVDGHARYAFYDEATAGRMLTKAHLPDVTPRAALFGGISLIPEPCGTTYETLMARLHAAGTVTMIDPNIRPSFITDEGAYRARLDRMLAVADIVKLSDEDLEWIDGDGSLDDQAARLLARGPSLLCLTEGAEGARGITAQGSTRVPATRVEVVDTVGAGDTFNAGVLAGLDRAGALSRDALSALPEATLAEALSLGIRAAAVTVSRAGANPPWASEL